MSTDLRAIAAIALLLAPAAIAQTEPRSNFFHDPFVQATKALKNCPVPEGPLYTDAQARAQSHIRVEKGTTCHYYGRCRLANAYLYDADIVARTARILALDGRFDNTSVWLLGQRRWVYLQGCVESRAAAKSLVQQIELIDDVEKVVDQLMVGESGVPPYPVAGSGDTSPLTMPVGAPPCCPGAGTGHRRLRAGHRCAQSAAAGRAAAPVNAGPASAAAS